MKRYLDLVLYKTLADLRAESARAYFGFVWWIFEPIMYMGAFYLVFGILLNQSGKDYVAFLLTGLIVWKWFAGGVALASSSIMLNDGLIRQVYLPKVIFPTIAVLSATSKYLVTLLLFLVFIILSGYGVSVQWLWIPVLLVLQFFLIWSVGSFLASLMPFFPDLRLLVENGLLLLFFLSGIFFDIASLSQSAQNYLMLNPMAIIITSYREILIYGLTPPSLALLGVFLFSIILSMISIGLIKKFDQVYPKVV